MRKDWCKEEILAVWRGDDGVWGKKKISHKQGGKYWQVGDGKRWRMDGGRTDGCRERERERKPMGRKVARSQQGKLMWAAEFEIVPQECGFFWHKLLFFFQQEKLSCRRNSQRLTPLVADCRCSVGGVMKVVSAPTPPKTHYLLYPRTQQWFMSVKEKQRLEPCHTW